MTEPSSPPPNYGTVTGQPPYPAYPQPGMQAPVSGGMPQEPPPKYELPKEGPYAPPPTGAPSAYPQQQYPPQGYQGTTTVVTQPQQTVIVHHAAVFGPMPVPMQCPNCQATITTTISHQSGGLTWLTAGLLCLFGCWLGCCLIPFCIPDLQDVEHSCPNCHKHIGTYSRL